MFCSEAGVGGLNLHMDGPFETRLDCHERGGNCEVEYIPFVPGNYDLHVTHGDGVVPGVTTSVRLCHSSVPAWFT